MKTIFGVLISFSSVIGYAWGISELVDIKQIDSTIITDIKYATKNNFTGQIIYSSPICLVHKNTAYALHAVQNELRSMKLGLKIWDGYRSPDAQQKLWDVCALQYPDEKEREKYVVNPKDGGRHTRGTSVDVTLVDAKGNELVMPTGFDDFSPRAWTADTSCCAEAQKNRKILQDIMRKHGFEAIKSEWWHFDLKGWQQYLPQKI